MPSACCFVGIRSYGNLYRIFGDSHSFYYEGFWKNGLAFKG